jgi:hypothetical protein
MTNSLSLRAGIDWLHHHSWGPKENHKRKPLNYKPYLYFCDVQCMELIHPVHQTEINNVT